MSFEKSHLVLYGLQFATIKCLRLCISQCKSPRPTPLPGNSGALNLVAVKAPVKAPHCARATLLVKAPVKCPSSSSAIWLVKVQAHF